MIEKIKIPKQGAGRKWAEKLKELGRQSPPKSLVDKLNKNDKKKVASSPSPQRDLEV